MYITQIHFPLARTQFMGPSQVLQGWKTPAGKGTGLRTVSQFWPTGMTNTFMERKIHYASNVFLKSPAQFIISLMGILTTITYHSLLTRLPNIQVFETHCFGEDVGKQILLHCQCWCELIHMERAIAVKIMCAFTLWSRNPTMNLAIGCTCTCVV